MRDLHKGVWQMSLAMLISGSIGAFVLLSGLPVTEVVFWRCLIGAIALFIFIRMSRKPFSPLTRITLLLAILGGIALVVNWLLLFAAYERISIGLSTVVYNTQPFMLVLMGMLFGERVSLVKWGWLFLAFGGVVILLSTELTGARGADWLAGIGLALAAAFFTFMFFYKRSLALQHFIDRMMLKLPVIGKVLNDSAIARFARTLAVTFKAGVPLVEALDSVAGATGNTVYEQAVRRMKEDVAVGYPVNVAMKQVGLFPHMVVQMTAIGEEAGALDTMLYKVAEFYEEQVNNTVDALSSLIEPMVMVIIGGLVGAIVIAMYLPIFKLAMTVM